MSITPGGVHNQSARICTNGLGKGLRSFFDDDVAPTNLTWHRAVQRRTIWVFTVFQSRYNNFLRKAGFTLRSDEPYDISNGGAEIDLQLVL